MAKLKDILIEGLFPIGTGLILGGIIGMSSFYSQRLSTNLHRQLTLRDECYTSIKYDLPFGFTETTACTGENSKYNIFQYQLFLGDRVVEDGNFGYLEDGIADDIIGTGIFSKKIIDTFEFLGYDADEKWQNRADNTEFG